MSDLILPKNALFYLAKRALDVDEVATIQELVSTEISLDTYGLTPGAIGVSTPADTPLYTIQGRYVDSERRFLVVFDDLSILDGQVYPDMLYYFQTVLDAEKVHQETVLELADMIRWLRRIVTEPFYEFGSMTFTERNGVPVPAKIIP